MVAYDAYMSNPTLHLTVFSWTFLACCLAAVSFVTADFLLDLARRRRYRRMAKRVRGE